MLASCLNPKPTTSTKTLQVQDPNRFNFLQLPQAQRLPTLPRGAEAAVPPLELAPGAAGVGGRADGKGTLPSYTYVSIYIYIYMYVYQWIDKFQMDT